MRKTIKITLWVLGGLLGLVASLLGLATWLLTSERLTPIVNRYASEYLLADVRFERIEVSLWRNFPLVSLELVDGEVVSHAVEGRADTLLAFHKLGVGVDVWGLVDGRGVVVRRVSLDGARIRAAVDTSGRASWDVVRPSSEVDTTTSEPLGFSVSSIDITGGLEAELLDLRDSTLLHASLGVLHVEGTLGGRAIDLKQVLLSNVHARLSVPKQGLDARATLPLLTLSRRGGPNAARWDYKLSVGAFVWAVQRGVVLAEALPLAVEGAVTAERTGPTTAFSFEHFEASVGPATMHVDGTARLHTDTQTIESDLRLGVGALVVDRLIGVVPVPWRGALSKVESNIGVSFDARIRGSYRLGSSILPRITASIDAPTGYLRYRGLKASVERFVLHAEAVYNPDTLNRSYVELQQLEVVGTGLDIRASGQVSDFTGDPLIRAAFDGSVDLAALTRALPLPRGITASGTASLSGRCDARLSHLHLGGLARTTLSARLEFQDIRFNAPMDSIDVTGSGRLSLGSNRNSRDSVMERGLPILRARLTLDTVRAELGRTARIEGSNLSVGARMAAAAYEKRPKNEPRRIYPVHGSVSGRRLTMVSLSDSAVVRLANPNIDFRITPSAQAAHIPHLWLGVTARSAAARGKTSAYGLRGLEFEFSSTIISKEQDSTERAAAAAERLARLYPSIPAAQRAQYHRMMGAMGIGRKDDLASGDLDLKLDDTWLSLLRRWRSTGRLRAQSVRVSTPYMPLRTSLRRLDFTFDNDRIALERVEVKVGRSDVELRGEVSNLRRALAGRGNLTMRLSAKGDTLDVNQLLVAANAGSRAAAAIEAQIGAQTTQDEVERLIDEQVDTTGVGMLLIVPKNLDLQATLNIKRGYYGDVVMDSLQTELVARNRILQINALKARTSIGAMEFNAVYATRSKTDITTGFDITLSGVDVAALIDLIPAVDSMLPMLSSFRGQLDCSLAATASLDSTMAILVPTLNAAGSLAGRNLVLLDGETFTEISKILKFKNRSRNLVDRISVELLVRNSAVELFPFVLEIDRYKAAVSGVQRLDMSFDYHISVLKSIVPFRLGVDIFGTIDNWKWKLVSARYKNENVPSYSALIDTTRVDLRRAITDIFSTGLRGLVLSEQAQRAVAHADSSSIAAVDSLDRKRIGP